MRQWLEEFMTIVALSRKTQAAIAFTILMPCAFLLLGTYMAETLNLEGPLSALVGPVREFIMHRYLEGATLTFVGGSSLAIDSYRRARARLLSCFFV